MHITHISLKEGLCRELSTAPPGKSGVLAGEAEIYPVIIHRGKVSVEDVGCTSTVTRGAGYEACCVRLHRM